MKNWIFKTFFPEEYKIIKEIIDEELNETANVRSAVDLLDKQREAWGKKAFENYYNKTFRLFKGDIPNNWEERLNAKIAELEQNSKNIPN